MINYAILGFGLLCFYLACLAFIRIKADKNSVRFVWRFGSPIGAFIWEDVLVFGALHFLGATIAFFAGRADLWLVFYLLFWVVRSAGETIYFFLQQFIEPDQYPHKIHEQMALMRRVFGEISDQKAFILMQVLMQSVTVLSLLGLVLLLSQKANLSAYLI